jgi:hypothetical protein
VIHSTPLHKLSWALLSLLFFTSLSWSQDWTTAQERDLRWSIWESLDGGSNDYSDAAAMQDGKREQFKSLFTSPDASHVLDIPGTPGLVFDEPVTITEYIHIAEKVLAQKKLYIKADVLWISPSKKLTNSNRTVSATLKKRIKWYTPEPTETLQWTVVLDVTLNAKIDASGKVTSVKIDSVLRRDGKQAYVKLTTKVSRKPIPFLKNSDSFLLIVDNDTLARNKRDEYLELITRAGLCFDENNGLLLQGKDKCLEIPYEDQKEYLKNPTLLSFKRTITGIQYDGRFTAGYSSAQLIQNGMYKVSPVDAFSSKWSHGFRLSFSAPTRNSRLNWTLLGGAQTLKSEVSFNTSQFTSASVDPDAMEYNRITDVTEAIESTNSTVWMFGFGSTFHFKDRLFIKSAACATATQTRYEATANVQQRGQYEQLFGITIDESGIYDFGTFATTASSFYENQLGWMLEGSLGVQIPYGDAEWGEEASPRCYLSAGIRHHGAAASNTSLPWIEGTSSLNGALNAFGGSSFQTMFIEFAFDLRRRAPRN